ncbi:PAS domain-containing protein [Puniceicoccales bacterium CK1056]|uniref:histidine kinase n=1 Tax=Oceanipulchritudo coccoides TaxID=2706888 RepID=A0A6B2LZV2_9BACT|nr:PAS domain-containing protein [Oceanipulchritudo coccoides]NDV61682.1 PAS domain-containing protein [Oceanipulchritudo coccoides]
MSDQGSREFLEERLASTLAEAENLKIQADTALKYAEQVWWAWNLRRKRLKIHAAGECILGYPHEDMEHSEQFWWDRIHPEDLLEVQQSLEIALKSPERIWRCEHRFMDVTGDWVWVEQAGFVHQSDAEGNPVEMVGTTRKTQERYQLLDLFRGSETLIDALVRSAPVAFWVRGPEGIILLSSQVMKEWFGPFNTTGAVDKLAKPEDLASWHKEYQAALLNTHSSRKRPLLLNDGSWKQFEHHLIPLTQGLETFAVLEVFIPL